MKGHVILGCYVALLLLEVYSLFPVSETTYKMFPFSEIRITFQVWVDYTAKICSVVVLLTLLRNNVPRYYEQINVFVWLGVGYIVDYLILYNEPVAFIRILGARVYVSYTLFMLLCGGFLLWKTWR